MKKLIRRLSRVADSTAQYCLLHSPDSGRLRIAESFRAASKLRRQSSRAVPAGHVPVYVGDEMERFVVSTKLLNHPVIVGLLDKSAQEYGYEQQGALKIPCHVAVFDRLLEALQLGAELRDLQDLMISDLAADDS